MDAVGSWLLNLNAVDSQIFTRSHSDEAWQEGWSAVLGSFQASTRIWVVPSWDVAPKDAVQVVRLESSLRYEVDRLAQELLNEQERVRLISHELGVALLRGRKPPEGRGPVPPLGKLATSKQVMYRFNGEFWTDELDELVVAAEDRCIDQ